MKKAIVLGVGNAQVDLLHYLKVQGWEVIGCSYRHEGRGLEYVDKFSLLNITDFDGVERLAQFERADLIYSIGSDLAMPTVAYIADKLGMPSLIAVETAKFLQDKVLLRTFLTERRISPIRFKKISTQADLDDWDCFPAIIKPVDSQGQRGVYLVQNLSEARAGIESSMSFSRSKALIVEEYLDGSEISVNTFIVNGETVFSEISDRLVLDGFAGGIPRGHVYPAESCQGDLITRTRALVELCNKELGIQNGPVYFQIKLTSNGPRIVEVTPRLDGCHMWRLIKTVSSVDLLDASINCLTGRDDLNLQVKSNRKRYYLGFYYCPPGKEFHKSDYDVPKELEYLEYYYTEGEIVRPINGQLEKVGYYIERLD